MIGTKSFIFKLIIFIFHKALYKAFIPIKKIAAYLEIKYVIRT